MPVLLHRSGLLPRRASRPAAAAVRRRRTACGPFPGLVRHRMLSGAVTGAVLAALCAAPAAGLPTPGADEGVSWSVTPTEAPVPSQDSTGQGGPRANYAYAVEPGDRVRDALVVTNRSAEPLHLTVYGTDARTTPSGHLDLLSADEPATGLGTWLSVRERTLDLGPGESAEVPFTLRVPDDAAPGDHSGGVVTSLAQPVGDSALTVDRRLALRVHARVAGDLAPGLGVTGLTVSTDLSANPFGAVTSTVRYRLTNTGTARVVPTETVTVAGPGGSVPATSSATLGEVLPGSTVERAVEVRGVRPLLRAQASVRVDGVVVGIGGGGVTSAHGTASGWAVPWALLGLVLLVVAGAVTVPLLRGRRAAGTTDNGTGHDGHQDGNVSKDSKERSAGWASARTPAERGEATGRAERGP